MTFVASGYWAVSTKFISTIWTNLWITLSSWFFISFHTLFTIDTVLTTGCTTFHIWTTSDTISKFWMCDKSVLARNTSWRTEVTFFTVVITLFRHFWFTHSRILFIVNITNITLVFVSIRTSFTELNSNLAFWFTFISTI